ncbi:hypothetical protein BC834DRAFT_275847 [Gloeopeniophorella convolvens]|nr:hypothetical protein BC834DRAFT_275847 [Gloeopeniophorella convolvens]
MLSLHATLASSRTARRRTRQTPSSSSMRSASSLPPGRPLLSQEAHRSRQQHSPYPPHFLHPRRTGPQRQPMRRPRTKHRSILRPRARVLIAPPRPH